MGLQAQQIRMDDIAYDTQFVCCVILSEKKSRSCSLDEATTYKHYTNSKVYI